MKNSEIRAEIDAIIRDRLGRGEETVDRWLTQAVVGSHPGISGKDEDFYECCAYGHVRSQVGSVLCRYKSVDDIAPDPQMVLPGFERLQIGYLIERESEQRIVALDQMTGIEITSKIADYRTMSAGCLQHANELERYLAGRGDALSV